MQVATRNLPLLEVMALHPNLPTQQPVLVYRMLRAAEAVQTSDTQRAFVRHATVAVLKAGWFPRSVDPFEYAVGR